MKEKVVGSIPSRGTKLKEIPYFTGYYITSNGNIYSTKSNKWLKASVHKTTGYRAVTLSSEGKPTFILVHRALAAAYGFIDLFDSTIEVDHINTDKLDNRLENYQYLSKREHKRKTDIDRGFNVLDNLCANCNKLLANKQANLCMDCYVEKKRKDTSTDSISIEDIEYWVLNFSWVRAAKELGLSDNGLRKRYKSLSGKDPKTIKNK